jgi:hypothetical protein
MMRMKKNTALFLFIGSILCGCNKNSSEPQPEPAPSNFILTTYSVNGINPQTVNYNVPISPSIKFSFSSAINKTTVASSVSFKEYSGAIVSYNVSYSNGDSSFIISPAQPLKYLTRYRISLSQNLKSPKGGSLTAGAEINFITAIDSTDKFPQITDTELLDLVQKQTFKYFWDFAHPVSGLARERSNGDNNTVTSGGSGFGIMAIITAIHRNFITRPEGLTRMQTIVSFLKNTVQKHKGAFPHWLNGQTGATLPFSPKDDGADLVETSYLVQGLLCARQYFNGADVAETNLRNDINAIWQGVEWDFFRKNNENVLYWHWSPNYNWEMNMPIKGWNEALITYILAASSPSHSVPKIVYDAGWAQNGTMKNGGVFLGYTLPLGPDYGGPLFFSHYSFLGIDPKSLTDSYANYETQVVNHTKINYEYCKTNPKNYFGYSDQCWGLTASDIPNGYTASSPTNDAGVIAPTAALSSFPYTPAESMKALKFFYYKLGDKLWSDYGFRDAFSLKDLWYAKSHLAIDQGPVIVMIENYRSGLLWNLFMSCPEVKTGMKALGFQSPRL